MQKTTYISGKTIPLAMDNVDTDLIIPAQYLTGVTKDGYGENLFIRLKEADPNFSFNQKKFSGANILITQENFGCGSSREHAVWALQEAGIQAIIASSFADIFSGNSAKNGLLLIALPQNIIEQMIVSAQTGEYTIKINIEKLTVNSSQEQSYSFSMDPFRQHCFMHGLDDLDYLINCKDKIQAHQQKLDKENIFISYPSKS